MNNRNVLVVLFVVALSVIGASPAHAAVQVVPYAGVSYNTIDMESINRDLELANSFLATDIETMDSAFGIAGGLRVTTGNPFTFVFELERLTYGTSYDDFPDTGDPYGTSSMAFDGTSTGIGLFASYALGSDNLAAYAGPIYHWGSITSSGEYNDGSGNSVKLTGSGLGFKAGGEFQHALGGQVSLLARAGYRSLQYDVEHDTAGKDEVGLSGFEGLVGLSANF